MADKLTWGVLGNALIAQKCVMPAITRSRNGRIRALATSRPLAAGDVVKAHGILRLSERFEDVIQDPQIDAVYIPLPNYLHAEWTIKALAAGKHVLCEKPLACSAEEARKMARAASENDRLLMEALMYRFHPRTQRIKAMISSGSIGDPRLVHASFCFAMAEEVMSSGDNCRLASRPGSGALMDVGSYGVSVARFLLEREPMAVQAQSVYRSESEVDIHVVANLRFPGEALATVEASFCSGLQQTYSITGSKGAIDLPQDAFIPWNNDALIYYRPHAEDTPERIVVAGVDQYQLMVEHFGDLIMTGAEPLMTLEDSINNLVVLEALAEAARTGHNVAVENSDL